ncbi:hypothetical protein [Nostoc sp. FACHB-190]|uniref:hypothetical protein n=1 Tax=Nostoc sp. FACHB-190 TaxID=2692838 RepID=UPI001683D566|nr:hypothetical protein [Nostoc sp. FACHB-190]MBD2303446.1 hypothetical protein [Nostoc sp. FACHB-190]
MTKLLRFYSLSITFENITYENRIKDILISNPISLGSFDHSLDMRNIVSEAIATSIFHLNVMTALIFLKALNRVLPTSIFRALHAP